MITGSQLMAKHRPPENYVVHFSNIFFTRLQLSLAVKLGSIQINARGADCVVFCGFFLMSNYVTFVL